MTPQDFVAQHWQMLVGRLQGPMNFRFLLQPFVGVLLAFRAAYRDAREGRSPYFFWSVFTHSVKRKEIILHAWEDVGKVFILATVLDVIYQWMVHRWIYPGQTLIVALSLAVIPYLIVRGPATRILRRVRSSAQPQA